MVESIERLEEMSFRTLPAMEEERYDGWVLRWADHGPRRTNSVNPIATSTLPIEDKILYCEHWFAGRGSPPIFRLTPLADAGLEQALHRRGYVKASPTDVMTAPIGNFAVAASVEIAEKPSTAWLRATEGRAAAAPDVIDRLADQLTTGAGQRRFASIGPTEEPAAIGIGIDFAGYTTIYSMHTQPKARRRGYARAILETLLSQGTAAGSTRAFLQVTQANDGAQRLYRGAGFSPVYSYAYRQRPLD
jgi:ribosomal protein S18 acetylase RimI-like enzyme